MNPDITQEKIRVSVRSAVCDSLGIDQGALKDNDELEIHDADSLDMIEILMALEDEFDVDLEDGLSSVIPKTVNGLVDRALEAQGLEQVKRYRKSRA